MVEHMKLLTILCIPLLICLACKNDTTISTDQGNSYSDSSSELAQFESSSEPSSSQSSEERYSSLDKSSSSEAPSRSSSLKLSSSGTVITSSEQESSSESNHSSSSTITIPPSSDVRESLSSSIAENYSSAICNPIYDTSTAEKRPTGEFEAGYTNIPLTIDGCNSESVWHDAPWNDMNYVWMSTGALDSSDYYGRFKVLWDADFLYLLVDITDEYLFNTPTKTYWQGDYVEVFVDFDQSGGDHWYNHQAFAYHVSTDYHAIDIKTDESTHFFDSNLTAQRTKYGDRYLWEIAIHMYNDTFNETIETNPFEELIEDHTIGFSIAYGDNDGSNQRDHFIGSKETHGVNNDEGYKDSKVFGSVTFKKQ